MPLYGSQVFALSPEIAHKLFDAETPAALPQASAAVAIPAGCSKLEFQTRFAVAPGTFDLDTEFSAVDEAAQYVVKDTMSSLAADIQEYINRSSKFCRVNLRTFGGGGSGLTVYVTARKNSP